MNERDYWIEANANICIEATGTVLLYEGNPDNNDDDWVVNLFNFSYDEEVANQIVLMNRKWELNGENN